VRRLPDLLEDLAALGVAQLRAERVTLQVAREADARREHDVAALAARLEPAEAEIRQVRKVEHQPARSMLRIWSRSWAARSKSSACTAWSSFRRSPARRCSCCAWVGSGGR